MRIDNLNQSTIARQNARIAAVERQAPLGNTSITAGRLRVVGLEAFLLEGTGRVTGTLYVDGPGGGVVDITGTLRGDGTIDWDGPVQLQGRVDVSGRIFVMNGGRFVASADGGTSQSMQLFYENGVGYVISYGVPLEMRAWASSVRLNENGLQITGGGASITMSGDGIQIVPDGDGPWFELADGNIYLHDLPSS